MKTWARHYGMLWGTAALACLLPEMLSLRGAPLWYIAAASAVAAVPLTIFGVVAIVAARGRPDHGIRGAMVVTAITAAVFWFFAFYPQLR